MTAAHNWPKTAISSRIHHVSCCYCFSAFVDGYGTTSKSFIFSLLGKEGLAAEEHGNRAIKNNLPWGQVTVQHLVGGMTYTLLIMPIRIYTNSCTIQLWHLLLSSEWSYRPFYNPGWNRLLFTWRGWGILSRLSPYSWRSYVTIFFLIIWKTLKTHWNKRKSWNNGSVLFKITLLLRYLNFYVCFFSFPWLEWKRIADG